MKRYSVILITGCLTVGALSWHQERTLASARGNLQAVRAELKNMEMHALSTASRSLKRDERASFNEPPLPREIIDLIRAVYDPAMRDEVGDAGRKEGYERLIDRIRRMKPADWRKYLAEVYECEDLVEEARRIHCHHALSSILDTHPRDGLDLYIEAADRFPEIVQGIMIARALVTWADEDFEGVLQWMKEQIQERPYVMNDDVRCSLVWKAAKSDIDLAFRLIGELEISSPMNATQTIMGLAKTGEARMATLKSLREFLPTIEDGRKRRDAGNYAVGVLGRMLVEDGFDEGSRWAGNAGLTAGELIALGYELGYAVKPGEEARWTEWFGARLPGSQCERPVRSIVRQWTEQDYQGVGNWLNTVPAGEMKNVAITAYAELVAGYEPEAAANWALTLGEGERRQKLLRKIYLEWPKNDPASKAAADAFGDAHGVRR